MILEVTTRWFFLEEILLNLLAKRFAFFSFVSWIALFSFIVGMDVLVFIPCIDLDILHTDDNCVESVKLSQ